MASSPYAKSDLFETNPFEEPLPLITRIRQLEMVLESARAPATLRESLDREVMVETLLKLLNQLAGDLDMQLQTATSLEIYNDLLGKRNFVQDRIRLAQNKLPPGVAPLAPLPYESKESQSFFIQTTQPQPVPPQNVNPFALLLDSANRLNPFSWFKQSQ